ncbi:hypothetical protein KVV02_003887 [Mortierella alpina]|uniref:FAD-binding domain-containing protein n=1 Tax=Mortierella alpina TaxID=64518 RepID=A0A9P8CV69_MORAP|nr:hypothetical protein KVV02_003887 [Mortierella alpina]
MHCHFGSPPFGSLRTRQMSNHIEHRAAKSTTHSLTIMATAASRPSSSSQTPVLISGAGPVGLMAAIMLTRLGVRCRIIERDMTISSMSKALSIHARTLEIFEQTGLIDRFLAKGHPISQFNFYFNDTLSQIPGLVNSISHYDYALFIEQAKTVSILNGELETQGLKVERGWELMETRVVDEGGKTWVETTIRRALDGTNTRSTESNIVGVVELDAEQVDKEYETEIVRSEYLIAADGGKSVVRHKVNIPFIGRTLDNTVILFDGQVETDLDISNITVINGRNNKTMNVFPLSNGQVRIMVDASELDPKQELTLEAFAKIAQAAAYPAKFLITSSSWLTFYKVNERRAESFAYKNRIFLAGDAAHVHSPAGGQGMNLGLQDAYNLTWKIALVLNGMADPHLLETYHDERAPVATNVIGMSANMFATGFSNQLAHRILRKTITTFASVLLRFVPVPAGRVSMLTIRYNENAINQRHNTQPVLKEEYCVGQRAHDGPLARVLLGGKTSEDPVRLHQLLQGPGIFHVLVFTSDMLSVTTPTSKTNEQQLNKNLTRYLAEWQSKWTLGTKQHPNRSLFNAHVIAALPETLSASHFEDPSKIQADSLSTKDIGGGQVYLDTTGIVHERYGVPVKAGSGTIVVVRPDSHVGYRVQGAGTPAWEDVDQYLNSILKVHS